MITAHALSHRMLRIFEAVRTEAGEKAVDSLYTEWGRRYFVRDAATTLVGGGDSLLRECLDACGLDESFLEAQHDEKWDAPIVESMEVAYVFGGHKTQTPTIVIGSDPPHGFKGPVMAPAPTGDDALKLWDAIQVVSQQSGFFELTRPRTAPPAPPTLPPPLPR